MPSRPERPTAVDLFAGTGGLSLGLERAGVNVLAGIEWDQDASDTYAKLHPLSDVLTGDIASVDFAAWQGVDLVVGGPPCQPWSTGGKRLGTRDGRDGWPAFLRAVRAIRPKAFIAENVAGFMLAGQRSHWEILVEEMTSLGYTVVSQVLNAADYGVPQSRQRCFIVQRDLGQSSLRERSKLGGEDG